MVLYVHTNAQHTVTQNEKKDIEWLDIAPTTKLTAKEFVENKTALPLPESHTLDLVSTHESRNGYRQYRYRQYYKGIPIIGADYIVHEKNAQVKKVRQKVAKNIQANTQPSVNEDAAFQAALHHINATRYAWEDETHEALVKKVEADEQATFFPTANLVFFNPNTKSEADYRLAYRLDIFAISPMRRAMVYIDIYKNNIGKGIKVHNCHNTEHYSTEDMIESDTLFPQDPVAVDVMWGSQKTYEYFRDTFDRLSFDSTDMTITSYIHYGENYDRAFWNGSWMTFGDGNDSTRLAPTSIDVVAHEFTHGIIDYSSDLLNYGESGALNESFSDIFGEIIEALHAPNGSNWIFGEDYIAEPGLRGSRNFANPKDPTMLNRQPDTYKGEFWYTGVDDNGGIHINSGVQNHWFYLLAFGGSGINDNGYAYKIEGIGVEKAARIAYGNLISLQHNDGYVEAHLNSIVVAEGIYGPDSQEALQTDAAWCAESLIYGATRLKGIFQIPLAICSSFASSISHQTSCVAPFPKQSGN